MNAAINVEPAALAGPADIAGAVRALAPRLRAFVRREVRNLDDAEDIVQDALTELVGAGRLQQPIEHVAGWLFRVARNRIIDRFRARRRRQSIELDTGAHEAGGRPDAAPWPVRDANGPEAAFARSILVDELALALEELPPEQREVFLWHELEGRSFRAMAGASGLSINTLLGRKHAAVRFLRRRLEAIHSEFSD